MNANEKPWQRATKREVKTTGNMPTPKVNRYIRFLRQCEKLGIPKPIDINGDNEHRFHSERKWRFDFAWPEHLLAVEIEGGAWKGGRHNRGKGFHADMVKYAEATLAGWVVLRVSPDWVKTGRAARYVKRWFERFV